MFYKIEVDNGHITIGKSVIGKIITKIVGEFYGKVLITNKSGKIPRRVAKFSGIDEFSNMEITMSDMGIDIKLYIAIRFGTSIGRTTEKLIGDIKETVEQMVDTNVNSVAITVTGIVSRNTAKRNIEIKG